MRHQATHEVVAARDLIRDAGGRLTLDFIDGGTRVLEYDTPKGRIILLDFGHGNGWDVLVPLSTHNASGQAILDLVGHLGDALDK